MATGSLVRIKNNPIFMIGAYSSLHMHGSALVMPSRRHSVTNDDDYVFYACPTLPSNFDSRSVVSGWRSLSSVWS